MAQGVIGVHDPDIVRNLVPCVFGGERQGSDTIWQIELHESIDERLEKRLQVNAAVGRSIRARQCTEVLDERGSKHVEGLINPLLFVMWFH